MSLLTDLCGKDVHKVTVLSTKLVCQSGLNQNSNLEMIFDYKVDASTDQTLLRDGREIICKIKPEWKADHISSKVYSDGLTNKLVGFWHGDFNDQLLVRISGPGTELFIDRQAEVKNVQLLYEKGLGSKFHGGFQNGFCYGFVPGIPVTTKTVRTKEIEQKIIDNMVLFHKIKIDDDKPTLFRQALTFLRLLPRDFPQKMLPRLSKYGITKAFLQTELHTVAEMCQQIDSAIVFCHNDILLNNIIWNQEAASVHFIDFEYAAPNYQLFDIANHFNEYAGTENVDYSLYPDGDAMKQWLRRYMQAYRADGTSIGNQELEELRINVNKFALASHLFWGLWALVQACNSQIEFDFLDYALIRFAEYQAKKKLYSVPL